MTDRSNLGGVSSTRKKYTPAFKAEGVRQVAAGTRQSDVARAQDISPALLGRWQLQALEAAVPSSAERAKIKQLRAALKRVEMERDILKKVVTIFSPPPQSWTATSSFRTARSRGLCSCCARYWP